MAEEDATGTKSESQLYEELRQLINSIDTNIEKGTGIMVECAKLITTAKISNKFLRESPYISNKFSRDSQKIQRKFHLSKRNSCHSNDLWRKLIDLEIQIF